MLKQSIVYLILSVLVVLFAKYAHLLIVYIDIAYLYVTVQLAPIFSNSTSGYIIRNVCSLVLLPLIITGIPALIYQAIKKKPMPFFVEATWLLWLMIVLSKILV